MFEYNSEKYTFKAMCNFELQYSLPLCLKVNEI